MKIFFNRLGENPVLIGEANSLEKVFTLVKKDLGKKKIKYPFLALEMGWDSLSIDFNSLSQFYSIEDLPEDNRHMINDYYDKVKTWKLGKRGLAAL